MNQRTTLNYRKLFLILKPHSLKLLKKNGKIPIPSDVFFFSLQSGRRLAGAVVCPLRGDGFSCLFWKPIFLVISSTSFSTIQGPAVQWAASLAWKDGAKVVADISRMEDPIFLFFLCSSCNPSGGGILPLPADVKTVKQLGQSPRSLEAHLAHQWTF